MKKLIIFIEVVIIILLVYVSMPDAGGKFFLMNCTAYSNHSNCISDKWRDGLTATGIPIREGIVAINVDFIDGKWIVKSPFKLGDEIYIEGLGNYSIEDTGRFAERNAAQDIYTIDIYMKDYQSALNFGRQLRKVWVIKDK